MISRRALLVGMAAAAAPRLPLEKRPIEVVATGVSQAGSKVIDFSEVFIRVFDGMEWREFGGGVPVDELKFMMEAPPKAD